MQTGMKIYFYTRNTNIFFIVINQVRQVYSLCAPCVFGVIRSTERRGLVACPKDERAPRMHMMEGVRTSVSSATNP